MLGLSRPRPRALLGLTLTTALISTVSPPPAAADKMVDATGAYNGYFVCEGAYGGNSIMRLLSPAMQSFWQRVAADDGAVGAATTNSSGWWELSMVFNGDRGKNANPTYSIHPAHFVCDSN